MKDKETLSDAGHSRAAWHLFFLVVSLFFLWGVANNLNDILIKQFKKVFELSDFQAGLVQSAFYLGYFTLAVPAAMFMRRFGYKGAIVLGLLLYASGAFLFYPAAEKHAYVLFLLALYVIASGLAFLETSANPLITVLGPREGAAQRLNLAQAFNPLGSITGVLVGQHFILSGNEPTAEQIAAMTAAERAAFYATESAAVQVPYLVIGAIVVVWALLFMISRFPRTRDSDAEDARGGGMVHLVGLLRDRYFMLAVAAQFFYVGGQVGVWSYLIRYAQVTVPGTPEKVAANFLTAGLVIFMLGRFAGAALMRYVAPARLLATYALINAALCTVAVGLPGPVGLYALVAASFFMSIMFPTIFALGLDGIDDEKRKLGSSLLVMSIIGGAILTAVMGATSDAFGIHWAMAVPLFSFAIVLTFARRSSSAGIVAAVRV
jgi:FHS family L-fucose permease-like MFS transporter